MAKEKVAADVREIIMNKMEEEGRTIVWLADKTKINYNSLHSCIKRKLFNISQEYLDKINEALGTNFK